MRLVVNGLGEDRASLKSVLESGRTCRFLGDARSYVIMRETSSFHSQIEWSNHIRVPDQDHITSSVPHISSREVVTSQKRKKRDRKHAEMFRKQHIVHRNENGTFHSDRLLYEIRQNSTNIPHCLDGVVQI